MSTICFSLFWIIFSYILGSFPSGYILTKLSSRKNILEIGWRKTSGSNVFKNIGVWQGILTALLDVGKGYLAVYLSSYFNLPPYIQALSGATAVAGHNWSCFLKFAGGRGVGTLAGALWALSPQILQLSIIPFLIITLLWNASISTIIFLITSIILAVKFNQFETVGILISVSLIPIFIKRLSPINEISNSYNKARLIKNRLIFDDDKPYGLRISRIIKGLGWW
jgi:glycerol-3-phosphate acyltransferase PlsY